MYSPPLIRVFNRVAAEAEGFQTLSRTGVSLITGKRTRLGSEEYAALKHAQNILRLVEKEETARKGSPL